MIIYWISGTSCLTKKKAYINESYGAEASKAGEEALNIAKNELDVQKKLAEARLSAGSSIGSHSQGYRMWKAPTNGKDRTGVMSPGRYPGSTV